MKKILFIVIILAFLSSLNSQGYVPKVPVFTPTRHNAIGGYHVTDTTDYFTLFANPAGIPVSQGKATWLNLDTSLANAEFFYELIKIAANAVALEETGEPLFQTEGDLIALLGESGINIGFEHMGPLALGSLHDLGYGTLGWGLFSKVRLFAIIPTIVHLDALAGFDNMAQLTYAAPIIDSNNHYLSTGISAKGLFMFEVGVANVEPIEFLTDIENINSIIPMLAHYGISTDIGLYYTFYDILRAGIVWRDPINYIWTQVYGIENITEFELGKISTRGSDTSSVDLGVGIDIPMGTADTIFTNFIVMFDYVDLVSLLDGNAADRNPLLNLSAGTELTLFDVLSLRFGLSDLYFSAGVGLRLKNATFDFAIFGNELGLIPGSIPQLNTSFAFSINY